MQTLIVILLLVYPILHLCAVGARWLMLPSEDDHLVWWRETVNQIYQGEEPAFVACTIADMERTRRRWWINPWRMPSSSVERCHRALVTQESRSEGIQEREEG